MTMNPYTVLAKAMLKASERRYQTMKDIEDIYRIVKGNSEISKETLKILLESRESNKRIEIKIDQIAQKLGLFKNRAYKNTIRPFDEDERNRAAERKEINKPDSFDGKY